MPFASAWSLWWIADRVAAGFRELLGCSDLLSDAARPSPSPSRCCSKGWRRRRSSGLGASPVLAYNLVLLAALVTNGAFALALLRGLGLAPLAAGRRRRDAVPAPLSCITSSACSRWCRSRACSPRCTRCSRSRGARRRARGLRLGVAFAAAYLLCGQNALFLALVGAPAALCLVRRAHLAPRSLLALAIAAATAAALLVPVVSAQLEVRRTHGFARSARASALGAAAPGAFRLTPAAPLAPLPRHRRSHRTRTSGRCFPGRSSSRSRSPVSPGACAAATPGASPPSCSRWPWAAVAARGAAGVSRSAASGSFIGCATDPRARAAAQLLARIDADAGGDRAARRGRASTRWPLPRGRPRNAGAARRGRPRDRDRLLLVASVELWPPAPGLSPAPVARSVATVARLDRPSTCRRVRPLVHLPVPASERVADYEETARAMLLATAHGRPLVNGYSSYFPRPTARSRASCAAARRPPPGRCCTRWACASSACAAPGSRRSELRAEPQSALSARRGFPDARRRDLGSAR